MIVPALISRIRSLRDMVPAPNHRDRESTTDSASNAFMLSSYLGQDHGE